MLNFKESVSSYLKASYPILVIETYESARCTRELESAAKSVYFAMHGRWDCLSGLFINSENVLQGSQPVEDCLVSALAAIREPLVKELPGETWVRNKTSPPPLDRVYVLHDAHPYLSPVVVRALRSMTGALKQRRCTIVLLSPQATIPDDLIKDIQYVDFALPGDDQLAMKFTDFVTGSIRQIKKYESISFPDSFISGFVAAAKGMTDIEAENALALATVRASMQPDGLALDDKFLRTVFEEKIATLKKGFLEYLPSDQGFESVGGLEALKAWIAQRKAGFSPRARELRLPYPKGFLAGGFRGCGKTVMAGAVAKELGFPLFKLDIGRLFGGIVGQTESNTRQLIRLLEGIGSAVVLID